MNHFNVNTQLIYGYGSFQSVYVKSRAVKSFSGYNPSAQNTSIYSMHSAYSAYNTSTFSQVKSVASKIISKVFECEHSEHGDK